MCPAKERKTGIVDTPDGKKPKFFGSILYARFQRDNARLISRMLVQQPMFYHHQPASTLPHEIGENQADGSRIGLGQNGFLSYGPYINLQAGRYFAGFELEKLATFSGSATAKLEIAAQRGRIILATRTIRDPDLILGIPALLTLNLKLDQLTSGVEVRLLCNGQPSLKVNHLTIFQPSTGG
ncbi:MAG: hypothetical protein J0I16_22180 [Rhizobiales bacterium]|nr:hypothetical protein [Hyphomicrobiales bacterium]